MNEITGIRLAGISILCISLSLALLLFVPITSFLSNPSSLGLWLALAVVGILILVGSGFDILLRPSRYTEDELSEIRFALLFGGSILALLAVAVQVL